MIKTVKQHQWRQLTLKAFFTFTEEILDEKFHFLCQKIVSMRNILLSTLNFRQYTFINPFHATGLFWYPLKTSENLWFSDVFRGYRKRPVARNGLKTWSFRALFLNISKDMLCKSKWELCFNKEIVDQKDCHRDGIFY